MKLPKTTKRYCRFCKTTTEHKIGIAKQGTRGKSHPLSRGSNVRIMARGLRRGAGSKGRYSKPAVSKWKRTGAKISKKTNLKYTCLKCKKTSLQKSGIRAKKVEFIQ